MILLLFSCILCGVLGRLGGGSKGNRLFRIVGISTIACIEAYILLLTNNVAINITYLVISFGLLCASISTYWDFCPWNKGEDNFFQHGFFISLSFIPIAIITQHWLGFLTSCLAITLWMGLWNKKHPTQFLIFDGADIEEFGRYFVIPIGIWLLLH